MTAPRPRDIPVPLQPGTASYSATPPSGEPRPYENAQRLGADLVAAERAIRSVTPGDRDLARWAWLQQQAYRDLVIHPEWRGQVRAMVPPEWHPAFDANLEAGLKLRELTRPRSQLPDWLIVAPPPAEELQAHYQAAAAEFGVAWEYLAAIHLIESRMGRIRGVSVAGARGPMQFLPSTWAVYGEGDIDDPRDAMRAAARYLVAHGAPRDMRRALYAYNHSTRYVDAVERYASVMRVDPRTYRAYYHWRVYYRTTSGDVVLNEGWKRGS
ncbi:MAG: transglycosylase SLT domain-containing protein [Nitriliruptorales bacterium]